MDYTDTDDERKMSHTNHCETSQPKLSPSQAVGPGLGRRIECLKRSRCVVTSFSTWSTLDDPAPEWFDCLWRTLRKENVTNKKVFPESYFRNQSRTMKQTLWWSCRSYQWPSITLDGVHLKKYMTLIRTDSASPLRPPAKRDWMNAYSLIFNFQTEIVHICRYGSFGLAK